MHFYLFGSSHNAERTKSAHKDKALQLTLLTGQRQTHDIGTSFIASFSSIQEPLLVLRLHNAAQ
jgi:hypothetical protein